jgi:uncharacterized protein YjbI with pentapeptide repeats
MPPIGVSLRGVHLTDVHLIGIVYLTGMHLTDVYLTGVHLAGVYLTGVHLTGVYLTGVHLTGVFLTLPISKILSGRSREGILSKDLASKLSGGLISKLWTIITREDALSGGLASKL